MPARAAIITGASRGIGFALAETLGEEGHALT
ncbi:MAG: SDR family NAD(P)-dependent oxidoreductase, partial [Solirubrobacterales bacterium]|nr:SDR family NAD(P)-dependent oxidoreductase [Solirubrobacterales bacterium]